MPLPRQIASRRPLRLLATTAGIAALLHLAVRSAAFLVPAERSSANGTSSDLKRRGALAATVTGSFGSILEPAPARAEQAWQLKLPRTWRVLEQNQQPPPEIKKPTCLVSAGNPDVGGDVVVLRIPLSTAADDPNAASSKDMISYFSTPIGQKPPVTIGKAVDAIVASQKTLVGLVKFSYDGKAVDRTRNGRRYVSYDFENSVCLGMVTKGTNGDTCSAPEDGSPLPLFERQHSILMTVTDEGAAAAGQKDPTYYLWLLDVSAPVGTSKTEGPLAEAVKEITGSFLLADEDTLEAARTVEVTKEQMEQLKDMQAKGALPQDRPYVS